ncbi:acylneuraminate cytidylyltransferase family protein [Aurantiacibacter sp. D1-12]|uniref:acylneuraminate cytidylyltransferase family protein n=1 Tax=Aurantiacibacter sp. D1-12 TaxID=2993658 RepID=UPI00237CBE41|nr:acylneuraminate cytidylyltransferase family protein [Aurantiacibacter sp. D1-12]MDE1466899.1 acylneuraminate cytidylyltransferase family protein [Aurantiacibacter sp. D1-12]
MPARLATILARGGSRGLTGKNIRPFAGEPLLARSVRQAKECGLFDCVAVSSDSEEYLNIAQAAGADILIQRPAEMANHTVTKLPAIRHAFRYCEEQRGTQFELVTDLAVTSPLRSDEDIAGAIEVLERTGAGVVLSGHEAPDNPYFNMLERAGDGSLALSKQVDGRFGARQQAPEVYALNGAVYCWTREAILLPDDTVVREGIELYCMPRERSLDIDDEFDFRLAELVATSVETPAAH